MGNTVQTMRHRSVLLLVACCLLSAPAHASAIRIAAIVNDDIITSEDVDHRRALVMSTSQLADTPAVRARILDTLVSETLQLQEGKRLSIDVTEAEITAAFSRIDASRGQKEGTLKRFLEANPQFKRTLHAQIRAQLVWNIVVERKIKRTITIAQDEITRAQTAQATAPGITEVQIAAISIPIQSPADEGRANALAKDLSDQLNQGTDFITLAQQVARSGKAELNPPSWMPESALQPAIQQALRGLQPDQITQPLRSMNSYQLITLLDRRVIKPSSEDTEVRIKQIHVPLPTKNKAAFRAAHETARALHDQPGTCDDTDNASLKGKATARVTRTKYRDMNPGLRDVVVHLNVGEVSEPLLSTKEILLVKLCDRVEPPTTPPPADEIKQKLFAEKLELEAAKTLRNLRRDAYIDIRDGE